MKELLIKLFADRTFKTALLIVVAYFLLTNLVLCGPAIWCGRGWFMASLPIYFLVSPFSNDASWTLGLVLFIISPLVHIWLAYELLSHSKKHLT